MSIMDTEIWDWEGGFQALTACDGCGKVKPEFHEGYCLKCWVKLNPPQITPDKDNDKE